MWNNHQVNYKYGESERNRIKAKQQEARTNMFLGFCMISILPIVIIILFAIR